MSNEIKSLFPGEPRRSGAVSMGPTGRSNAPAQHAGGQSHAVEEKVTLTETARKLSTLTAEVGHDTPVDEAKVARLRSAIESGDYRVNAEAIAMALLKFEHGA